MFITRIQEYKECNGVKAWNLTPNSIKDCKSLYSAKIEIKKFVKTLLFWIIAIIVSLLMYRKAIMALKWYNQLITYYLPVCYLLRIQQYPVNNNYNTTKKLKLAELKSWGECSKKVEFRLYFLKGGWMARKLV